VVDVVTRGHVLAVLEQAAGEVVLDGQDLAVDGLLPVGELVGDLVDLLRRVRRELRLDIQGRGQEGVGRVEVGG